MRGCYVKYCLFQDHGKGDYRFSPEMTVEWFGGDEDNAVEFVRSCYKPGEFSLRAIGPLPERKAMLAAAPEVK